MKKKAEHGTRHLFFFGAVAAATARNLATRSSGSLSCSLRATARLHVEPGAVPQERLLRGPEARKPHSVAAASSAAAIAGAEPRGARRGAGNAAERRRERVLVKRPHTRAREVRSVSVASAFESGVSSASRSRPAGGRVDRLVHAGERKRVAEGRRLLGGARRAASRARRRRRARRRAPPRLEWPTPPPRQKKLQTRAHNPRVARVRSGTLPSSAASNTAVVPAELGSPSSWRSKTSGALAGAISASARFFFFAASTSVSAASSSRSAAALRLSRACARARSRASYARRNAARVSRVSPSEDVSSPEEAEALIAHRDISTAGASSRGASGEHSSSTLKLALFRRRRASLRFHARCTSSTGSRSQPHARPYGGERAGSPAAPRAFSSDENAPSSAKRSSSDEHTSSRAPRVPRASPPRRRSRAGPRPPRTRERPWPRARGACSAARARGDARDEEARRWSRVNAASIGNFKKTGGASRAPGPRPASPPEGPARSPGESPEAGGPGDASCGARRSGASRASLSWTNTASSSPRVPETRRARGAFSRSAVTTEDGTKKSIVATSSKRTLICSARSVSMGSAAIQRPTARLGVAGGRSLPPRPSPARCARRGAARRRAPGCAGALRWRFSVPRWRSHRARPPRSPLRRRFSARPRTRTSSRTSRARTARCLGCATRTPPTARSGWRAGRRWAWT